MNPPPYTRGKLFLLFVVFFAPYFALVGAGTDPCSELAHAKSFSFFTRVAAGTVVSGRRTFSQVLHRPNPVSCFKQLVKTGNNEAKMYAMAGLRELDRTQFDIELERLTKQSFTVVVVATAQQGVLGTERGDRILKQIRDGVYRHGVEFCRKRQVLVE